MLDNNTNRSINKGGKSSRHMAHVGTSSSAESSCGWAASFGETQGFHISAGPSGKDEASFFMTAAPSFLLDSSDSLPFDPRAVTVVSKEKVEYWPQDQDEAEAAETKSSSFNKEQQKQPSGKKTKSLTRGSGHKSRGDLMMMTNEKSSCRGKDMKSIAKRLTESSHEIRWSRVEPTHKRFPQRASEPSVQESKRRFESAHHDSRRLSTRCGNVASTTNEGSSHMTRRPNSHNSEISIQSDHHKVKTRNELSSGGGGSRRTSNKATQSTNQQHRSRSRAQHIEAGQLDDTKQQQEHRGRSRARHIDAGLSEETKQQQQVGTGLPPASAPLLNGDTNLMDENATLVRESVSNTTGSTTLRPTNDLSRPTSQRMLPVMRRPMGAAEENRRRWISRGLGRVDLPTIPVGSTLTPARRARDERFQSFRQMTLVKLEELPFPVLGSSSSGGGDGGGGDGASLSRRGSAPPSQKPSSHQKTTANLEQHQHQHSQRSAVANALENYRRRQIVCVEETDHDEHEADETRSPGNRRDDFGRRRSLSSSALDFFKMFEESAADIAAAVKAAEDLDESQGGRRPGRCPRSGSVPGKERPKLDGTSSKTEQEQKAVSKGVVSDDILEHDAEAGTMRDDFGRRRSLSASALDFFKMFEDSAAAAADLAAVVASVDDDLEEPKVVRRSGRRPRSGSVPGKERPKLEGNRMTSSKTDQEQKAVSKGVISSDDILEHHAEPGIMRDDFGRRRSLSASALECFKMFEEPAGAAADLAAVVAASVEDDLDEPKVVRRSGRRPRSGSVPGKDRPKLEGNRMTSTKTDQEQKAGPKGVISDDILEHYAEPGTMRNDFGRRRSLSASALDCFKMFEEPAGAAADLAAVVAASVDDDLDEPKVVRRAGRRSPSGSVPKKERPRLEKNRMTSSKTDQEQKARSKGVISDDILEHHAEPGTMRDEFGRRRSLSASALDCFKMFEDSAGAAADIAAVVAAAVDDDFDEPKVVRRTGRRPRSGGVPGKERPKLDGRMTSSKTDQEQKARSKGVTSDDILEHDAEPPGTMRDDFGRRRSLSSSALGVFQMLEDSTGAAADIAATVAASADDEPKVVVKRAGRRPRSGSVPGKERPRLDGDRIMSTKKDLLHEQKTLSKGIIAEDILEKVLAAGFKITRA